MVCFQYKTTASTRTCCQCAENSFCVVVLLWLLLEFVCTEWFKEKARNSIMNQCITSSFLNLWYMCWLSWVKYWNESEGWEDVRRWEAGWSRDWPEPLPRQTMYSLEVACLKKKKARKNPKPKTSNPPKASPTTKQMLLLMLGPSVSGVLRNGEIWFINSDLQYEDSEWGCHVMSDTCSTPSQLAGG